MKLVDILAVELKSWPEGVSVLSQLRHNGAIINGRGYDGREWARLQIADDTPPAGVLVTEAQWQDAVDALYPKLSVPEEWTGEGLPPVGIDVEIHNKTCRSVVDGAESFIGTNCKVLATFVNVNGYEMVAVEDTAGACMCFRADMCGPVRTPEQIAAEEREAEVKEMQAVVQSAEFGYMKGLYALYDAGCRMPGKGSKA